MLKNLREKVKTALLLGSTYAFVNVSKVLAATTPDEDEVNDIASKGLKIFFGALAGFAVIMGAIEFYRAFMAHKEDVEQGGFGGSKNQFSKHIFSGIMCMIAAAIVFIGLRWTQSLFDLA